MMMFGAEHGDKLYKRFHTMRTKAAQAGVPFFWRNFTDFWNDFITVLPNDYHPSTHRVRFNLTSSRGYCLETMKISVTRGTQRLKSNNVVVSELLERMLNNPDTIPDNVKERIARNMANLSGGGTAKPETVSWVVDVAFRIAEKLDSGYVILDESFLNQ
jgi:hypothetical protein